MTSGQAYQTDSVYAPIYSQMPTLLHKSSITFFPYPFPLFTHPSLSHSTHTIRSLFLQGLQAVWQVATEKSHKSVLKGKFASFDGIVFAALLSIFNDFKVVSYNSINRDMHDNCRNVINSMRMLSLFVNRVDDLTS